MKPTRYIEFGRRSEQYDFFKVEMELWCFRFLLSQDRVENRMSRLQREADQLRAKLREITGKLYAAAKEIGGKHD